MPRPNADEATMLRAHSERRGQQALLLGAAAVARE